MKVTINIDARKIMAAHGMGSNNGVQKHLASEVVRLAKPYTPMQQGVLQNSATIASDGSEVVYPGPYAHYQYYGKVMVGRAPKKYNGEDLSYHGAMRGARWIERMMADKQHEIEKSVETYIKRG